MEELNVLSRDGWEDSKVQDCSNRVSHPESKSHPSIQMEFQILVYCISCFHKKLRTRPQGFLAAGSAPAPFEDTVLQSYHLTGCRSVHFVNIFQMVSRSSQYSNKGCKLTHTDRNMKEYQRWQDIAQGGNPCAIQLFSVGHASFSIQSFAKLWWYRACRSCCVLD